MKKKLIILYAMLASAFCAYSQDWQNRAFFEDATRCLKERGGAKVLFIGDSITQLWLEKHPGFFFDNGFYCRGISGQTSAHTLLRFREEVAGTGADVAVILIGANDIARNAGPIPLEAIAGHIESMCEIARANGIKPVLCSLIPAKSFYWRKQNDTQPDRDIPILNSMLAEYASGHKIAFVDLFSPLVDLSEGNYNGLPEKYSDDGVHPTLEGYLVMENELLPVLRKECRKLKFAPRPRLRLMSYNVRNCIGMDRVTHFRRVASVIGDFAPDAVAVQELDSATTRSKGFDVLQQIARHAGYKATFCPSIDFQGGKYGIGLLSRETPLSVSSAALPGREERRALLIAEFEDYYYCCTHLSLTREDRMASLEIILAEMEKLDKSKDIFLAGDFNAGPDSDFIKALQEHFDILSDMNVKTFPSDNPRSTIDYIVRFKDSGKSYSLKCSAVPGASTASDHRPVVCDF